MPLGSFSRLALAAFAAGALLMAIFVTLVLRFRTELKQEMHTKLIGRDADVLHAVALQQLATEAARALPGTSPTSLLYSLLHNARQEGMLAMALFDADGATLESVPASQLFVELPVEDSLKLLTDGPITRYHASFPLGRLFPGVTGDQRHSPVLEILLPLRTNPDDAVLGFVRYHLDARVLARELAEVDANMERHTFATVAIGSCAIATVVLAAFLGLRRAQRVIAERNERLLRTNFELTLAAKASAVGQIASHLIHGLQGPVAGLRAIVAGSGSTQEWQSAANYTERLQGMIQETVELLGDTRMQVAYELSGRELADTIRRRNEALAREKGVKLEVQPNFRHCLDNHRGGLLCLIASNLVQNAIAATPAGRAVSVSLNNGDGRLTLRVSDEGSGIPESVRDRLFEPGHSTKPGGTGLGLAISQLLARQIGGELLLVRTSAQGTTFQVCLPLDEAAAD
jgi:signal transduction histidine kinase